MIIIVVLFILLTIIILLPHILTCKIETIHKEISFHLGVPRVIYRTYSKLLVPTAMYTYCHSKWLDLNPNYSMVWFTDQMCDDFMFNMGKRIYKAYKSIRPGAYKADFWRACILYKNGGIYIDSYTEPFYSMALMLQGCWNRNSPHQFIAVNERGLWGIHNGFMISTPKHPFMKQYILDILSNIENKYYGNTDLDITGPKCLIRSINKVLGKTEEKYQTGWNNCGALSFYLFELRTGLYKPIYKNGTLVMNKKYSFIAFIRQKWINSHNTYTVLWKNRQVYL